MKNGEIVHIPVLNRDMYEVSSWGRVRNKFDKFLKKTFIHGGYIDTVIMINGRNKSYRLHRLLAYEFVKNSNVDYPVNHIDGNKFNISLKNLEWVSFSENIKHAYYTGIKNKLTGYMNPNSKITQKDVDIIYDTLVKFNGSVRKTYYELKTQIPHLTEAIIYNIKRGLSWNMCDKSKQFTKRWYISESDVIKISKLLVEYNGDISKVYNNINNKSISKSMISKIKNKYTHSKISDKIFTEKDIEKWL